MTWGRTSGTHKENGRVPAAFIKQQMKRGDSPVSFIFNPLTLPPFYALGHTSVCMEAAIVNIEIFSCHIESLPSSTFGLPVSHYGAPNATSEPPHVTPNEKGNAPHGTQDPA